VGVTQRRDGCKRRQISITDSVGQRDRRGGKTISGSLDGIDRVRASAP
jgi:hypothetical protein